MTFKFPFSYSNIKKATIIIKKNFANQNLVKFQSGNHKKKHHTSVYKGFFSMNTQSFEEIFKEIFGFKHAVDYVAYSIFLISIRGH